MHRLRALLLLSVATVSLAITGCSMQRLLYQQADWLLLREVDSYLDLSDGQRERIALALQAHLTQHRHQHLPGFAAAFGEAAARARRGFSEQDAHWALEHGRVLLEATVELVLPSVAAALADLTPEQRRHLARRMSEREDEYAQSRALGETAEKRWQRSTQRSVAFAERWTGTLSAEQVMLVEQTSRSMPDIAAPWLAYTRERRQALLTLLESGPPPAAIEAFLRKSWIKRESWPPELLDKREQRIAARIRLIARLAASLSSAQRAHLVARLQGLADDARALASAA